MSKKELYKLQKQWYKKLKHSGFEDIEWINGKYVNGMDSPFMKDTAFKYKKKYNENTAQHYRLMRNFASNFSFTTKKDYLIFEMYADGIPFRDIIKKMRQLGYGFTTYEPGKPKKPNLSLFTLHHLLKGYIKLAYEWNRTDSEGLLLPAESEESE